MIDRPTDEELHKMFDCVDCGKNTDDHDEYYMVHDEVWRKEARMTDFGGMLCISCLEERIGRRLTQVDFTNYPVNTLMFTPKSDLLLNRLGIKPDHFG